MKSDLRLALLVDPISARAPNAARVRAARHAVELARALERRGHVARIFGLADPGADAPGDPEAELGRRLASFEPEAVLAYDALSPAAWVGSRLSRRRRIPLVLVEAGAFAQGSWVERAVWRLGEVLWGAFVRRAAGALVALDPVAREQALQEGFQEEQVRVVPHGVDVERFRPGLSSPLVARHRIRGRILLHPGPLDARSGADLLVQAFARTLGQGQGWSLVLASEDRVPRRLRAMADRLGVGARVHGVAVQEPDLPELLSAATVTLLPALDDAPLGGTLARCLASGRPVLASDLSRLRHLLGRADAGLLAPPGDLAAWVEALRRVVSAPQVRQRWGENARALAVRELSWERVSAGFEEALGRAAAGQRRAARGGPLPLEQAG
jgi:glycosyltransferase involved in cell wall biosynthesis